MSRKTNKVWSELFSPPCPNCGSTKTKEELLDIPAIGSASEILERLKRQMEGKHNSVIRTWKCFDCETVYDEKGRYITHEGRV